MEVIMTKNLKLDAFFRNHQQTA